MKNIQDIYPLAPLQQGLLFHSVYEQQAGMHLIQLRCTLRGSLDLPALQRAWQTAVERHPILRTSFVWENVAEPLQIVHRQVEVPVQVADWSGSPRSSQQARLATFLNTDRSEGFNLQQPPLMRVNLLKLTHDEHVCIWTCHHLLVDGWSLNIILQEVFQLYAADVSRYNHGLSSARPYRDYIAWLKQQDLGQAESYWRQALQGFGAPTQIKPQTGMPAPPTPEDYALTTVELSLETSNTLRLLANHHALTLNTFAQGAWAILLSRHSGEDDVVFGATVAGRPTAIPGIEQMVGLFINTLPVRIRLNQEQALLEWLKDIQTQQSEARAYEHSPLVQVQGWSDVPRGTPLFESLLAFENFPRQNRTQQPATTLQLEQLELDDYTNYPLDVEVIPGEQITLRLRYNRQRYSDEESRRLLARFGAIWDQMASTPQIALANITMLTAEERQLLLADFNGTQTSYPATPQLAHDLFEQAARQHPNKIALVYQDHRLTFAELNQRANQLAAALIEYGLGPETFVGLFVERSHYAVIGALAAFKASGAYVPLDPAYPRDRLALMLEDAAPQVVMTLSSLRDDLPAAYTGPIIELDRLDYRRFPSENPPRRCTPENVAYLIYTSGTTGRPKGVLIQHDSYWKTCLNYVAGYRLDSFDAVAMNLGSISFDVFNGDMARSILIGATLVICPNDTRLDPKALYDLIAKEQINIFESTPVLINAFLDYIITEQKDLSWFRVLISSADAWRTVDYRKLRDKLSPHIRLINAYGITEATIDSTFYEEQTTRHPDLPFVSIGKPFPNIRLYILDSQRQLIPQGLIGELYIGGPCLARGYLHQAALTNERFVADPFVANARMYKTGDLARWLPDGTIEFLGRSDHQVKIRGFRIELGEIESLLRTHPAVRDVVVMVRDEGNTRQLVGYVVIDPAHAPTPASLRDFLRRTLPTYMLPVAFVFLERLPISPNGKLDRKELPIPTAEAWIQAPNQIAPRTPLEQQIAEVWGAVLGQTVESIDSNFFDLGGHSLLVMQVIARLRDQTKIDLPLRLLFESPTIAGLAASLEQLRDQAPQMPIKREQRPEQIPLSFAQQRLWFLDQLEPESAAYNLTSAVRITGALQIEVLNQAFNALIARHETLRTTFVAQNGIPYQSVALPAPWDIAFTDLSAIPSTEREQQARERAIVEFQAPFDLACGPLWRSHIFRMQPTEHVLLLTVHHIIADEASINLIIRDLMAYYNAYVNEQPITLPNLSIQYADFAIWQRQTRTASALAQQLGYWRQQLAGELPTLSLPTRPQAEQISEQGAFYTSSIPAEIVARLQELGQSEQATMAMITMAAFHVLLQHASDQSDILVGTDINQRDRTELEQLVGIFLNQLVIRSDLSGNPSLRKVVRQIRETMLRAYANQDVPFEEIVKAVQPKRQSQRSPLFQVKLVFINRADTTDVAMSGLEFAPFEAFKGTANFDLVLFVEDGSQLSLNWIYRRDLFDQATIARFAEHYLLILKHYAQQPDWRLNQIPMQPERTRIPMEPKKTIGLNRFKNIKPQAVSLPEGELVSQQPLRADMLSPWLIQPQIENIDLAEWTESNKAMLQEKLDQHGAILFRGFNIDNEIVFERFARTLCSDLFKENGEHTPVTKTGIQTPVFYPADKQLLWHNENSFNYQWPAKIFFACATPPSQGGATPIVDSRQVYAQLDPNLRELFKHKQVMYMRNYGDGLGLDWRTVFRTNDKAEVEAFCRQNHMLFEWKAGDRLRTRQIRPAVIRHPRTGELSWFNQAQHWHVACLDAETRDSLLGLFVEEDLPRHCYYGDGSPIEDSAMEEILGVYRELEISTPWQKGDVMLLDNTLVAHGRDPYVGERRILVALAEMTSYSDLPALEG